LDNQNLPDNRRGISGAAGDVYALIGGAVNQLFNQNKGRFK
jgi:hypothetical protein